MNNIKESFIEGGSVQAIEHGDGYRFFVKRHIDDIFIIFIPDLTLIQAKTYAKILSVAWDEFCETHQNESNQKNPRD
jgi:hypothetical protein